MQRVLRLTNSPTTLRQAQGRHDRGHRLLTDPHESVEDVTERQVLLDAGRKLFRNAELLTAVCPKRGVRGPADAGVLAPPS